MPQLFLRRKNRVVQETWNGTGKSSVSSLIRMSTDTSATVRRTSCGNTCTWVGPLSAHGHWLSMMVCKGRLGTSSLGVNIRG
jgi:hypothetical protein